MRQLGEKTDIAVLWKHTEEKKRPPSGARPLSAFTDYREISQQRLLEMFFWQPLSILLLASVRLPLY
jgi:hypothetical protein